jgi:hypothetical protein
MERPHVKAEGGIGLAECGGQVAKKENSKSDNHRHPKIGSEDKGQNSDSSERVRRS